MDSGSLEKIIHRREKNYIWLEKELKRSIGFSASVLLALFLMAVLLAYINRLTVSMGAVLGGVAILAIGRIFYRQYRKSFWDFKQISEYLEAYENGNYQFHSDENFMKEGIQSQIVERLERMGRALSVMKGRMVDEKENTKALITDLSHQLKTPLSALKLSYELMAEGQLSASEQREILERAGGELLKLQNLMDSLTNLSRMEAGMIQIEPETSDIIQTLINAVSSTYMKAYQKNIEIELDETADMLTSADRNIVHDTRWTEEAFINLLDNAIKYSDEHTTVRIQLKPQISYLLICFEDEGPGIPREEYQNIFKRFYRMKIPQTNQTEGSGVGLYLVRRILMSQGGNIRVDPGKEKGSVFQVMLPKKTYT